MRKYYKIAALVVVIAIISFTLTSGITKERSDGGGKDLVEELYDQAAKQNDNLESIEDGIGKFYKKKNEAVEKYNSFTYYNNRYYSDAYSKAATIADAATKQRANELISKSEAAYKLKLADWQTRIAALNAKERELNDLHTLLKVMITEPMIARYQTNEFPDNGKLKEAADDLEKVIGQIKAITK